MKLVKPRTHRSFFVCRVLLRRGRKLKQGDIDLTGDNGLGPFEKEAIALLTVLRAMRVPHLEQIVELAIAGDSAHATYWLRVSRRLSCSPQLFDRVERLVQASMCPHAASTLPAT